MENFERIKIEDLEVVMELPKKKGMEEGISNEILKMVFRTIKDELLEMINGLLSRQLK